MLTFFTFNFLTIIKTDISAIEKNHPSYLIDVEIEITSTDKNRLWSHSDFNQIMKRAIPEKIKNKNIDSERGTALRITLVGKNKATTEDKSVIYLSLNN